MSAAKKEEESELATVNDAIDPHEERRILHQVFPPWVDPLSRRKEPGQPKLEKSGSSLSFTMGRQTMSHATATKLYLDAVERENKARIVREFWATVFANWNTMTEPVKSK